MSLPNVKKPCKDCPFRKDTKDGWLGRERMTEILSADSFTCHKHRENKLQCAGHMLIKGEENIFVKTAKQFGLDTKLQGRELVFESTSQCVDHHDF